MSERLLGALALMLLGACFSHDRATLCQGEADCGKGTACIVGRCRPLAEPAMPTESRRIVLSPTDVSLLSSKNGDAVELDAVPFGRASLGDVVLLLQFDARTSDNVNVDSVVLTLTPPEHAPPPETAIGLSVATIDASWRSDALSWARQPPLSVPEPVSAQAARGRAPLRIDVTHLFRVSRGLPNGIAVLAHGDDPMGAVYSTGLGAGMAPRLELYVSDRAEPMGAPSASASTSASAAPRSSASASAAPSESEAPPIEEHPRRPKKLPDKKLPRLRH